MTATKYNSGSNAVSLNVIERMSKSIFDREGVPQSFFSVVKSQAKGLDVYFFRIKNKTFARFETLSKSQRLAIDKVKFDDIGKKYSLAELSLSYLIYSEDFLLESILSDLVLKAIDMLATAEIGCCSHYQECSDNRNCVQTDAEIKYACNYRQNLKAGRVFYGINRNI